VGIYLNITEQTAPNMQANNDFHHTGSSMSYVLVKSRNNLFNSTLKIPLTLSK